MRILITGASGHLGRRLVRSACQAGYQVWGWTSPRSPAPVVTDASVTFLPVELTDPVQVAEAYSLIRPMAVIHAAAISSIADCYRDPVRAYRVNAEATRQLVGLCVADIARLIYVSTDLVFDGQRGNYNEDDLPQPLSQYGKSKLDGERAVIQHPGLLVARVSWLVGLGHPHKPLFLDQQIAALRNKQTVTAFEDEWRTPLDIETAANALVALSTMDVAGILHLGGPERLSRYEMIQTLARVLSAPLSLVQPIKQSQLKTPEPRPQDVSLDSSCWRKLMPDVEWLGFEASLKKELGNQ